MFNLLDYKLQKIINKLHNNGATCFLVGGYVRDHLLQIKSQDIDIEVHDITPEKFCELIKSEVNFSIPGKFEVYVLHLNYDVEFAFPRTEQKSGTKHTDFQVTIDPFLPYESAALRRDFTVNAIGYDLKNNKYIYPQNSENDLKTKQLVHVSNQFGEDPLRVYRALRFVDQLNFDIAEETFEIMKQMQDQLKYLSSERILIEYRKFFKFNNPQKSVEYWMNYFNYQLTISQKQELISQLALSKKYAKIINPLLFIKAFSLENQIKKFVIGKQNVKKINTLLQVTSDQALIDVILNRHIERELLEEMSKFTENFNLQKQKLIFKGLEIYSAQALIAKGIEKKEIKKVQKKSILKHLNANL